MKKQIDDPRSVVPDMLSGAVALAPAQARLATENVVVSQPLPAPEARSIAVLSGGGSRHEPAHAGYVGAGMLTAAVAGDVFTSPSTDAVQAAIEAAAGPAGASATAPLSMSGTPVEIVVVADDVALRETVPKARRRGFAGTVLVHKVAGAPPMELDIVAGLALTLLRARGLKIERAWRGTALGVGHARSLSRCGCATSHSSPVNRTAPRGGASTGEMK